MAKSVANRVTKRVANQLTSRLANKRAFLRSGLTAMTAVIASALGAYLPNRANAQAQGKSQTPAPDSAAPDSAALKTIAFGSCNNQEAPQHIWQPILAAKPDLFIFAGDNVYASGLNFSVERLKKAHAKLADHSGFSQLIKTTKHMAIWDDHDYGLNDGGKEWQHKQDSKNVFLEFWKIAGNDPRRARDGLYCSELFGPPQQRVQVILLDTRWNRSDWRVTDQRNAAGKERYVPSDDPSLTMLGQTQWAWLEQQLRVPAQIRLIVSGIQVLADGHGWECWAMMPLERQRLFDLIAKNKVNGCVFLSGDRHIGAIYQTKSRVPYPLFDVTSSGMTHAWKQASEAGPNRIGDLVTENHFGLIEIDWVARKLDLVLQTQDGQNVRRQSIPFSALM